MDCAEIPAYVSISATGLKHPTTLGGQSRPIVTRIDRRPTLGTLVVEMVGVYFDYPISIDSTCVVTIDTIETRLVRRLTLGGRIGGYHFFDYYLAPYNRVLLRFGA